MPAAFRPPGLASLADLDVSDASYGDEAVALCGVVSARRQSVWRREGFGVHAFTLAAWRPDGGELVERPLLVLRAVRLEQAAMGKLATGAAHRMRALLADDGQRAVFVASLPAAGCRDDEALRDAAERADAPRVFRSKQFGELVLGPADYEVEVDVDWQGRRLRVAFEPDDEGSLANAVATVERLWADRAAWAARAEAFAAERLLDLRNDTWSDEDEAALTPAEFAERLDLTSISAGGGDAFAFWFDDGDLFWGHTVVVYGSLADGLTDATIAG